MEYRREIDGLRALAVLPVIFFHAGLDVFGGGFIGVDVFFVISGYLITSIIVSEKQAGTFSLANFYERRARRILPALFLVMISCLPLAWFLLLPAEMASFSQSLIAVAGFVSNIFFWRTSGYFETAAELKPLLHTWSLAVEEQYYLLFPVFLLLTWRMGKRWIISILVFAAIVSLAAAQWGSINKPTAAFFLLPTRGWELLIGAFAAFHRSAKFNPAPSRLAREGGSAIGLTMIACAIFAFDKQTPFPGLFTLIPTVGAVLLILFATEETLVGRLLANKLIVGLGLISYSAYLWHQPLFAFARHRSANEPSMHLSIALGLVAVVLAYFSWKYVEKPFRDRKRFSQKQVFVFGAVGSAFFAAVGLFGQTSSAFEDFYLDNRLSSEERAIYSLIRKHTDYDVYEHMVDDGECIFWARETDRDFSNRFAKCHDSYGRAVVILGDSHGMTLYNAFAKSNTRKFLVGVAQGGCRPHNNLPTCHYDSFLRFAKEQRAGIELVLFHQSGAFLLSQEDGTVYYHSHSKGDVGRFSLSGANIQSIREYLNKLSAVVPTVWIGPFVEARVSFSNLHDFNQGFFLDSNSLELFNRLDLELAQLHEKPSAAKYRYVPFSSIARIDKGFLLIDGCLTYRDADHFSRCGESIIGSKISEVFDRLFTKTGVNTLN